MNYKNCFDERNAKLPDQLYVKSEDEPDDTIRLTKKLYLPSLKLF